MTVKTPTEPGTDAQGVERPVDRIWESFGSTDPYYGVLSDDRYHTGALTPDRKAEFFTTGQRHIERVLATARRTVDPGFAPKRALDFGCGVGRLVLPLARTCEHVTGVDISPAMLREATANAREAGLGNTEFVLSDDALSRVTGSYDLVHSYIVLQHLGVQRGLAMFRQLIGRVAPNGIAALHIQYERSESGVRALSYRARRDVPGFHRFLSLVRGDGASHGRGLMHMNSTPLVPVFEALQRGGFGQVHVEFANHGHEHADYLGLFLIAQRVETPLW